MGKFNGVLIASDYDNTIAYTEGALRSGIPAPPVSQENREAIEYFMAEGGIFSVATGRALPSFDTVRHNVPMNGPTILFNGAAIYDYTQSRYLHTAFLPEEIRNHVTQVQQALGKLAFKVYHDNNSIFVVNPNSITAGHQHLTHLPAVVLDSIYDAPSPILKVVFEEPMDVQKEILSFVEQQPWRSRYEVVSSSDVLLEVTVHGANKGGMVEKLAQLLGIERRHVYTMGDHANDIPMLQFAQLGFAPQNAIDAVKQTKNVRILSNCWENATAEMISVLDRIY
ncbi:MAG: HAD-IIB family hydrolase [Ruminococcaceae bacterium]|nr:HAD-IIB family hydrolase [Oscillospiraceae bacterium]